MSDVRTAKRLLLLYDLHVPYEDKRILATVKEFADDFKPHYVVAGGDWMSSDQVSRFPNDCDVDLKDEFARVRTWLRRFHVTHYLMGNHEERLMRPGLVPKNLRKQFDPVTNLKLKEQGILWRPYDWERGIFHFGKLKVLHGFFTNQYAARSHADAFGCCAFGHTHRMQTFQPKKSRVAQTAFNLGCLCKLRLPYALSRYPTGWSQGFGFCYIHKSGFFNLYPVRLIGNEFIINEKYYKR